MKKSEAAIGYVCFGRAADLDIDPILFSATLRYILSAPKARYDEADIVPATGMFLHVVAQQVKQFAATMKPVFSGLPAEEYVSTALHHFKERHGTGNFVDYIFTHCKNELKAVIDYSEMIDTGFMEKDLLKTMEQYAKQSVRTGFCQ